MNPLGAGGPKLGRVGSGSTSARAGRQARVDIAARAAAVEAEAVAVEEGSSIGVFWPMDIFNQHSATKDLGLTPRFRRKIVEMAGVQGVVLPAEFTTDIPDECTPLCRCCEKTCSCQPSISPARD